MRDDHLVGEGRLFEPDIMLPVQYFTLLRKQSRQGPEYQLVVAMLQDAVECFQKYRHSTDETGRELFEDARDWIESDDQKWPFSFENVCAVLKLDAAYLRRGLCCSAGPSDAARNRKVVPIKTPPASYPDVAASVPAARAS